MRDSRTFIIHVIVKYNTAQKPTATLYSVLENKTIPKDKMHVQIGDRVSWVVETHTSAGQSFPGYEITFTNPRFCGVDRLKVPLGGTSPALPIQAMPGGKTSWNLIVDGIGLVLDPDMQSTNDTAFTPSTGFLPPPNFTVTWTYTLGANGINSLSAVDGKGHSVTFPLAIQNGSVVTFVAQGMGDKDFAAYFQVGMQNTQQGSPAGYPATWPDLGSDSGVPMVPMTVNDPVATDMGQTFYFALGQRNGNGASPIQSMTLSLPILVNADGE